MIVLDVDNPKSCKVCPLRFDSMCIPQNRMYIRHGIDEFGLKDWLCPIVAEIDNLDGIKILPTYHRGLGGKNESDINRTSAKTGSK